jgi:Ca-activated chloride channel family protein
MLAIRKLMSTREGTLGLAAVAALLAVALLGGGGYLLLNRPAAHATCRGGSLPLRVAATPDQAEVLAKAAAAYAAQRPTAAGRCVDVQVRPVASVQAAGGLAKGWDEAALGPRPDVWVPAASVWAQQLELQLRVAGQPSLVPPDPPRLASSPLVIAMPRPMAQALGWPDRRLGWRDLLGLAANPAGWRLARHPEWGPFKLGRTDPTVSTPGIEALLATVYAAAGQGGELTVETLKKQQEQVRRAILGVERTPGPDADTPASLLGNLSREDQGSGALRFMSAAPLDEKSVLDYNQGNPTGRLGGADPQERPNVPLAAVYPSDGTLVADHPWIVLRAPWVDDARRQAAAGFLGYLQSAPVQASFQQAGFRSADGRPGEPVNEANGLLPDQPARVLPPPDPQITAAALQGWKNARKRSNVLAVFDVSGSMKQPVPGTGLTKMDLAKRAALRSLALFAPETNLGSWEFSTNLDGGRDWRETVPIGPMSAQVAPGKTRRDLLAARLTTLHATSGDTGLYDTSLAAYEYIRQHYVPDRLNLVVLLTDGINDDPGGGIDLKTLLAKLRADRGPQPVRFITIAYGADADTATLKKIAAATGGASFQARDPRDIDRVFVDVISNL